jgi:hypothetical protein
LRRDAPVCRLGVEFDADAARDLRKLGATAERAILRYLRQRMPRPRTRADSVNR